MSDTTKVPFTTPLTHGSVTPPRRVKILIGSSGGGPVRPNDYFKPGQHAYVISYNKLGGCYCNDHPVPIRSDGTFTPYHGSRKGELCFLVSKTKDMKGGALWFSKKALQFSSRG